MNTLVKRCLAAAVLLLAATLPDYRQLHTSEAGLRLITDFEGCRLSPYKCQAEYVDKRHWAYRRCNWPQPCHGTAGGDEPCR